MDWFIPLLENFGLPVAIIIALGIFIYKIYSDTTKHNKETIAQMQEKCQAREEKLYNEIGKNREVISQAIATIAQYAEKLEVIQADVNEIKTDVIKISEKLN